MPVSPDREPEIKAFVCQHLVAPMVPKIVEASTSLEEVKMMFKLAITSVSVLLESLNEKMSVDLFKTFYESKGVCSDKDLN